jgi:hypothetical protein
MQMVRSEITLEKNMSKSYAPYKKRVGLWDYMTHQQQKAMSYVNSKGEVERYPTWHSVCVEKTGVSRPGKTARDRAKKLRRLMS